MNIYNSQLLVATSRLRFTVEAQLYYTEQGE